MPTPNTPRKIPAKKTPEKAADLGQQLARRKSQDFKTKIQGWNDAGAGVKQEQNEIVVIEDAEDGDGEQLALLDGRGAVPAQTEVGDVV